MKLQRLITTSLIVFLTLLAIAVSADDRVTDKALSLFDCISIALENNPQISISHQSVVTSKADLDRARSEYWPQLSLTWQQGPTSTESFLNVGSSTVGFSGSDVRNDTDIYLRQSFWQLGRPEAIKYSKSAHSAANQNHEALINNFINTVCQQYYTVLVNQALLDVAAARVSSSEKHLLEIQAKIEVGEAAPAEVYSAEDDISLAQLAKLNAERNYKLSQARLKMTMGLSPLQELNLAQSQKSANAELPSLEEAIETAMHSRPDVLAGQSEIAKSNYGLQLARINQGPVMEVFGEYSRNYAKWEANKPSWQALFSLSWPVFDGGARKADVTAAKAKQTTAFAGMQLIKNQAGMEVESALIEMDRARRSIDITEKSVVAAEGNLAAVEERYSEGLAIFLEVSDALDALTEARINQVQSRYDVEAAYINLQRAMGLLTLEAFK